MKGHSLSSPTGSVTVAIESPDHTAHQLVSLSIASARSTALVDGQIYRLWSSVACFIKFGDSAVDATTSDFPISAEVDKFFACDSGTYVAAIVSSGTGVLYITRLK